MANSWRLLLLLMLLLASLQLEWLVEAAAGAGQVEVALGADGAVMDLMASGDLTDSRKATQVATIKEGDGNGVLHSDLEEPTRPQTPEAEQPFAPKSPPDELYALQAEIDALDDMIRLQEEKLRVLRELRSGNAVNGDSLDRSASPLDGRHSRETIERRLDAVVASSAEANAAHSFDTFFVERAAMQASEGLADVKLLFVPTVALDLVVLAHKSGQLEVYTSSHIKILETTLGPEIEDVKAIALEMYNYQPCLVVSHNGSKLSIFALHLDQEVQSSRVPSNDGVPVTLKVERLGTAHLEAPVAAFTMMEGTGRIVAGSETGKLAVFSVNGTQLDHFDASKTRVQAMASQYRRVAFSDGSSFFITSIGGGLTRNLIQCHGSTDIVTSLAFDQQQGDVVYAGTNGGDVLVFRYQWGSSSSDRPTCQLLSRAKISSRSSSAGVALKAVKGFVLAAELSVLTVFNISHSTHPGAVSLTPVTSLKQLNVRDTGPLAFDYAQGVHESSLMYLSASSSAQLPTIMLFRSLLPVPDEQRDFPWVFIMYVVTAIVAVIAVQFYSRRGSEQTPSPWEVPRLSHRSPFGRRDGGGMSRQPSFGHHRAKASAISSRIARQQGRLDHFAVGEAFEEDYGSGRAYEEDELRAKYRSISDDLRQHLASTGREQ